MICPKCGYERQKKDDDYGIIPKTECPKCGIIYAKYQKAEQEKTAPKTISPKPKIKFTIPSKKTIAYLLIIIVSLSSLYLIINLSRNRSLTEIYDIIGSSVVAITTYDEDQKPISAGSGFFIDKNKLVTNHHVLSGSTYATIKTRNGSVYNIIKVVSEDASHDLVIASVDMPKEIVTPVKISKDGPKVGEEVGVIGNPVGFEQSLSNGIVAAYRELREYGLPFDGKYMQITAPVSPGSSGSPVINKKGEVVGVAFLQRSKGQNLNFSIPISEVGKMKLSSGYAISEMKMSQRERQISQKSLEEQNRQAQIREEEAMKQAQIEESKKKLENERLAREEWIRQKIADYEAIRYQYKSFINSKGGYEKMSFDDKNDMINMCNKAALIGRELGDVTKTVESLRCVAAAYSWLGDHQKSLIYTQQAAALTVSMPRPTR